MPLVVHGLACVPLAGRREAEGALEADDILLGENFRDQERIQQDGGERGAEGGAKGTHIDPRWWGAATGSTGRVYCRGT